MKLRLLIPLFITALSLGSISLRAQTDINLNGYTQTFDDEFNTLSVSTSNPKGASTWFFWPPYGSAGAYSASTWDVNAFTVTNGILSNKAFLDSSNNWHSGNLSSMDPSQTGFAQKYGYFEIRCQMPSSGTGAWTSFWLQSQNSISNGWNGTSLPNEEIDIFEWYGVTYTNNSSVISEGNHNWTPTGGPAGLSSPNTPMPGGALPWQGYHIYGCQVDPVHITWYIDGVQTNQIATPTAYITTPFYMMVDYALGGGWPLSGMVNNSTMLVDWVRVYSLPTFPQISSATSASGTVGHAFSYQITASNSPTSYGATNLPAGLSINTTTGLISGTPTTAAATNVTINATNSSGTGSATLGLTIGAALPSPWISQDIGSVGVAGSASYVGGIFTVNGSGTNIWGTADTFQYVNQTVSGANQTIIARVTQAALSSANQGADSKTGIMFRDTTGAGSEDVYLVYDYSLGLQFMDRTSTGGGATQQGPLSSTLPIWLKLVKTGTSFSGYYSSNGTTWTQIGSAVTASFTSGNYLAGLLCCSNVNTQTATTTLDNVSVTGSTTLPSPWLDQDIGSVGAAGSASYASGAYTIAGAGADIWGTADAFNYVYQSISGDCNITARVASLVNTNVNAKAAVMIRSDLTAGSAHAMIDVSPGGGVEFICRTSSGAGAIRPAAVSGAAPYWVRLTRAGNLFTVFSSPDGTTWTTVGSQTITMGTAVYVGLPVCSHVAGTLTTAVIDNVTVAAGSGGLPSPWTNQDIGSVGLAGSTSYSGGVFTVTGSGADIWGTADAFQYVNQTVTGTTHTIIARVTQAATSGGTQPTDGKAGIMFRDTTSAGSEDVYVAYTNTLGLQFIYRTATNGGSAQGPIISSSIPVWLKLVKSTNTFSGYYSTDGVNWTQIGTAQTVTFTSGNYLTGLISCSHDNTKTATSLLDNVSVQ